MQQSLIIYCIFLYRGKIQHSIEAVLKAHVKSNYPAFLEATEQIHQVGDEMASLKHLIENTQKLIVVSYIVD
ncbi:hypothetical protein EON65_34155 [archaeon]|nr:MAG: hypothetical protein EON65_34155 [archaeon]